MVAKTVESFYLISWGKLLDSDINTRNFAREAKRILGVSNESLLSGFENLMNEGVAMSDEYLRLKRILGR